MPSASGAAYTVAGTYVLRLSLPSDGPTDVAYWPVVIAPDVLDVSLTYLFPAAPCFAASPCNFYISPSDQYGNAVTAGLGSFIVKASATYTAVLNSGKKAKTATTKLSAVAGSSGIPGLLMASLSPLVAAVYNVSAKHQNTGGTGAHYLNGTDVAPLQVTVGPGPVSASGCSVLGGGIVSAIAGQPATFFVRVQDAYNNDIASLLPTVDFAGLPVVGDAAIITSANVSTLGFPVANVTYTPFGVGALTVYVLAVGASGLLGSGQPYTVDVQPAAAPLISSATLTANLGGMLVTFNTPTDGASAPGSANCTSLFPASLLAKMGDVPTCNWQPSFDPDTGGVLGYPVLAVNFGVGPTILPKMPDGSIPNS